MTILKVIMIKQMIMMTYWLICSFVRIDYYCMEISEIVES